MVEAKKISTDDYPVGVTVCRFQVDELHEGHTKLIDHIFDNHKKVIIFLGIPFVENELENPLDFITRKMMVQTRYPEAIIIPLKDNLSDSVWSKNIDDNIRTIFGDLKAILYGSRDSFIPFYEGTYPTIELVSDIHISGTEIRDKLAKTLINSPKFRSGVIYSVAMRRAVTYPTVDIGAINDKGQILLAKKPNEKKYRFIGGFVDRTDCNWENAAKREFSEETGGGTIGDLKYVGSFAIDDYRYRKSKSGIMTTLFIGKFSFGNIKPSDDISELRWTDISDLDTDTKINKMIMPEHIELMSATIKFLNKK